MNSTNLWLSFFTEQLVLVDCVGGIVLVLHVLIEAAEFLPFDDGESCIQHVQVCYLDVRRVSVVFGIIEGDALGEMIPFTRRARGHTHDSEQVIVIDLNAHPDINK